MQFVCFALGSPHPLLHHKFLLNWSKCCLALYSFFKVSHLCFFTFWHLIQRQGRELAFVSNTTTSASTLCTSLFWEGGGGGVALWLPQEPANQHCGNVSFCSNWETIFLLNMIHEGRYTWVWNILLSQLTAEILYICIHPWKHGYQIPLH